MAPAILKPIKSKSRGSHFASQVVFSAKKLPLMSLRDLRKIGKSSEFHEMLVAVARDANKYLRPALERAMKACNEGENESSEARKIRKEQIEARIAKGNKRRDRAFAKNQANVEKYIREQWYGGPPPTEEVADDADIDAADTIIVSTSIATATARNIQIKGGNPEVVEDDDDEMPGGNDEANPTEDDRQLALVNGEPLPIDKTYCCITLAAMHADTRANFNAEAELKVLLDWCIMKLEPEGVRDELLEYLDNRLETASATGPPMAYETSSVEEILQVLHVLNRLSVDAMIRCAFAQILLFFSVHRQATKNREIPRGIHRIAHLNILQALATKHAGHVSVRESTKIYKSYEKDYNAGKRWVDIIDMFGGGNGIVMLFVVAEVGSWYVTSKFTEYQQECLRHISSHLYGMRALVTALGPKALERYCSSGCLEKEVVDLVESVDLWGA